MVYMTETRYIATAKPSHGDYRDGRLLEHLSTLVVDEFAGETHVRTIKIGAPPIQPWQTPRNAWTSMLYEAGWREVGDEWVETETGWTREVEDERDQIAADEA